MAVTIAALKGTGDVSSNRIRLSMDERIALLDPNANPFTLLTQKYSKIAIGSHTRRWLTDVVRPEVTQINYATAYATNATSFTVDTGTGSYFVVGDLWRVFDSGEVMYVVATATDVVQVTRNYPAAGSTEPGYNTALEDNDYLEFIGNCLAEGATSPTAMHTLEVEYSNYTQIQRTVLYLTNTEIAMLMNAEQDLPYEVRKKGIEHARKVEYQHLFGGKPMATTDATSGKPRRTSAGLWWFMRKYGSSDRVTTQTELTESEFMTWLRHCFRYGSNTKYLFAPPLILSGIELWAAGHQQISPGATEFGVNIQTWITPHGIVKIINHKMLEGHGGAHAFLLDMDDIKYCYVNGRDSALLTGREANDEDSKKQEYLCETTLQVKNFDHHGYLYGVTSVAA